MTALASQAERPAIDLHFESLEIDNPSVGMRLCLSAEIHTLITEGLRTGHGYAVLLVARNEELGREDRAVYDPLFQTFFFHTFSAPGKWEIGVFLFERRTAAPGKSTSHALARDLRATFLERGSSRALGNWYTRYIPDFSSIKTKAAATWADLVFSIDGSVPEKGACIAKFETAVSVPEGIFAKAPSVWVKAFGNYFSRRPPYDECAFRRRLIVMVTLGLVPWFVIEAGKRLLLLIGGSLLLLFGVKGSPHMLRSALRHDANLSLEAAVYELGEKVEFMGVFGKHRRGWAFTPGMLLIYYVVLRGILFLTELAYAGFLAFWKFVNETPVAQSILVYSGTTICVLLLTYFTGRTILRAAVPAHGRGSDRRRSGVLNLTASLASEGYGQFAQWRKERNAHRTLVYGERQASFAQRHTDALVCSTEPKPVSLAAMPPEMQTFRAIIDANKRKVCRPFG